MGDPCLVILAAGMGSRFGGLKQITAVDDHGHAIIDFSLYDAWQAQDLEEITYSLMEEEDYSPLATNIRCNVEGIWLEELREAMDKGPVLIVVDCSGLNYLLYCLSDGDHRIKSLR